jgi:hypothetical protein
MSFKDFSGGQAFMKHDSAWQEDKCMETFLLLVGENVDTRNLMIESSPVNHYTLKTLYLANGNCWDVKW